jgi:hypothetical protein
MLKGFLDGESQVMFNNVDDKAKMLDDHKWTMINEPLKIYEI